MNNLPSLECEMKDFFTPKLRNLLFKYKSLWLLEHALYGFNLAKRVEKKRNNVHDSILECIKHRTISPYPMAEISIEDTKLIKSYILRSIPFVIRGGAKTVPLYKEWGFDFFNENYGEKKQTVFLDPNYYSDGKEMKLKEIIRELRAGTSNINLLFGNLIYTNEKLKLAMGPFFLKSWKLYKLSMLKIDHLFMSGKDTYTFSHSEFGDNLFLQVRGRKTWKVFKPSLASLFLPLVRRRIFLQSGEGFQDLSKENPILKAPHYLVVLEEGDLLYNPCLHWHYVETHEDSISISSRWSSVWNFAKHPFIFCLFITATNPSIFYQLFNKGETSPKNLS
jgi:hypothetical protein